MCRSSLTNGPLVANFASHPASCWQGCGEQRWGALVNFVAFYIFAIPLSLALAFYVGWGPEGLYIGMAAGPAIQMVRKAEACRPSAVISRAKPCALRPAQHLPGTLLVACSRAYLPIYLLSWLPHQPPSACR